MWGENFFSNFFSSICHFSRSTLFTKFTRIFVKSEIKSCEIKTNFQLVRSYDYFKISVKHFGNMYDDELIAFIIGLNGIPFLWIFGIQFYFGNVELEIVIVINGNSNSNKYIFFKQLFD